MNSQHTDILIIGAGLSGLSLAWFLKDESWTIRILEARTRLGGRIHTEYTEGLAPLEHGATWLGRKHLHLNELLKALSIDIYPQLTGNRAAYQASPELSYQWVPLPTDPNPSYRIVGGSSSLIERLYESLPGDWVQLDEAAEAITDQGSVLEVRSTQASYTAKRVIATLPPRLLVSSVRFEPGLPEGLKSVAEHTHTWMGESIKFGLQYKRAYWKDPGLSGTLFSNGGPATEMYDHSAMGGHALKGFVHPQFASLGRGERQELILAQLERVYGRVAREFTAYQETPWAEESFTFSPYHGQILPHQNNGHPALRQGLMGGKFFLGGSETAQDFPGYMDGAVERAKKLSLMLFSQDLPSQGEKFGPTA